MTSARTKPRILLQASISYAADDWHIGRFSMLADELRRWGEIVARNREPGRDGRDPVLLGLDRRDFDEVWIFGVDSGMACGADEVAAINRFQRHGGGLLTARDHQDMGKWLRDIDGAGHANFFHDPSCREPDPMRHCRDDQETPTIDFPNYRSGPNGDVQVLTAVAPGHPLLRRDGGGDIERFPAHPHEGAIAPPAGDARARSVARGKSTVSGRLFDLVVAFERSESAPGRAVAHSSFHHFADYNWKPSMGAPSFVTEPPSDAVERAPSLLDDVRAHVRNCVDWLRPP